MHYRRLCRGPLPVRIEAMCQALPRQPILTAQALDGLRHAKQQILDAAANQVPERLVLATVAVSLQLAQGQALPDKVLPARIAELVQASLVALAQQKWKPGTALKLERRRRGGRHGLSQ